MTNSNGPSDDTIAAYAAQLLDLESEIEKKQADKKDVYANARDTYGKLFANSLKLAIKRHRMDSEKLAEAEETDAEAERMAAIIARGLVARGARAHVENIEEFDAETGEVLETKSTAARKDVRLSPTVEGTAGAKGGIVDAPDTPSEPAGTQAPPVDTNVTAFRTHDPATHFLNSKGLARLHGCQGPEACASSQPRSKLCFACSVAHDGPVASEASA